MRFYGGDRRFGRGVGDATSRSNAEKFPTVRLPSARMTMSMNTYTAAARALVSSSPVGSMPEACARRVPKPRQGAGSGRMKLFRRAGSSIGRAADS